MNILITGFDPFGGEKVNPAFEVLKKLKKNIAGAKITLLEVPTVFGDSVAKVTAAIEKLRPDAVLMIGQAGGRYEISVERVGINLNDARIPDNKKQQPIDESIDASGPAAYFATLPVKDMVQAIRKAGVPASVSYTAGTFVCNHLLYGVLNYCAKKMPKVKAGFIHIPFLIEQAVGKTNTPSMGLPTMVAAIEAAAAAVVASASKKRPVKAKRSEGTVS